MTKFVDNTGIGRCVMKIQSLLKGKLSYKSTVVTPTASSGATAIYTLVANAYGGDITQIIFNYTSTNITQGLVTVTDVTNKMQVGDRLVLVNPTNATMGVAGVFVYSNKTWSNNNPIKLLPGNQITIMKTSDKAILVTDTTVE